MAFVEKADIFIKKYVLNYIKWLLTKLSSERIKKRWMLGILYDKSMDVKVPSKCSFFCSYSTEFGNLQPYKRAFIVKPSPSNHFKIIPNLELNQLIFSKYHFWYFNFAYLWKFYIFFDIYRNRTTAGNAVESQFNFFLAEFVGFAE